MTALVAVTCLIAGMVLADVLQARAWRRFVAQQRERTAEVLERAE